MPIRRQAIFWTNDGASYWRIYAPLVLNESSGNVKCFIKGIKNGCPCIVEIRGTRGCALVGDPARAVGECRDVAKAQP